MFKKNAKTLLAGVVAVAANGLVVGAAHAAVQVDINADIKHSVNGVNQFDRKRRITMHASPIENEWIGEKEKYDYLMELGVHFGRDAGTSMWYFQQTEGDASQPPAADDYFPWGHLDEFSRESLTSAMDGYHWNLQTKYEDAHEYFDRSEYMIGASQPRPAMPNWSTYSWFGGALNSENPWRPRTMEQAAEWYAAFLQEAYLRDTGDDAVLPMPRYWEVVNEPDMQMNTTGHEGHLSTWEELFRYHNVVADVVRARLGNDAPLIGGMTWGLHDFHLGDATAFGAPRLQGEALLTAFYGADSDENRALKDRIRNEIFAPSATMNDSATSRGWYQWDVIWKGFLDTAGANMDFYSIHLYDWPSWQTSGGRVRAGSHSEAVMDLLEWYDDKMVPGPKKEVIVSEFGAVHGMYQEQGTTLDRIRMRWEKLKPFSQMQMQFLERPDYITMSLPFIVVKGQWGDGGATTPYAQSVMDRDYDSCTLNNDNGYQYYSDCVWNFNPAIHWFELWRDIDGTRLDTWSSDRDIQVDAYVNNNDSRGENHLYVIINSMEKEDTELDLSWAGIQGNSIQSISLRHLYLDEAIDAHPGTGQGKPIMAEAELAALPDSVVIAADSTMVLDIQYASAINPAFNNNESKFSGEPLSAAAPHRVGANGSTITAQINGVSKPARGEAQLRITAAFYMSHFGQSGVDRSSLKINGHDVAIDNDLRGEGQDANILATLEFPFPVEYLADNGNNSVEFSFLPAGDLAAMAIQVWDFDKDISRSTPACKDCVALSSFNVSENSASLKVSQSQALTANFSPANASNKRINWSSTNPSVVSVDQNGVITGTGVGSATISASSVDGGMSDNINVSVSQLLAESVAIVGVPSNLYVGSSKQLSAAVRPIHAPDRSVVWSVSPASVAEIDQNGVLTARSAGTATVTVETSNGIRSSVDVQTSIQMPTELILLPESTLMPSGDSLPVQVQILPADSSLTELNWVSSNAAVADVVAGDIVALSEGTARLTASINGTTISDYIDVEVVNPIGAMQWREAESFDATGGTTGGMEINVAAGNINYNQTGDWADYVWNFEQAGIYQFALSYGTIMESSGIEVLVDGVVNAQSSLSPTAGWDAHREVVVSNAINVPSAGTHTVRIKSIGAPDAFQWNADKVGLRLLKVLNCAPNCTSPSPSPSPMPSASPSLSPSPSPSPLLSPSPSPSPSILASPSPLPSSSPSLPPGGGSVLVELEDFDLTGRDGAAIGGDSILGFNKNGSTINWNTSGDYADYPVSFDVSGNYRIVLDAASPMTGELGVIVSLDGNQIASSGLSATGDWEVYESQIVADSVAITSGNYTLRVQSSGASAWQWNADKIRFVLLNSTEPSPSPSPSLSPSPSPVPSPSPSQTPAGDLPFSSAGTSITQQTLSWSTGVIDTSAAASFAVSMKASGTGPMENSDYLNIYYKIDGGAQLALSEFVNAFAQQSVALAGLSGSSFELIVEGKTSWGDETYTVSDISVVAENSPLPSPSPSPSTQPSPQPSTNPAEPILTEGEDFVATGGTQDGFTTRTFWGTTTFADHILTGAWADYEVVFPVSGNYDLSFIASTMESSDSNAKIYIDGVAVAETPVYGNNLNVFVEHEIATGLAISAGTHTVRIEATGAVLKWHFFLDSFTFSTP
ncbi:Ig-like domain-containing protein [Agaribacterium haliotis]|uniref:Ig-like domain-containing protein n=1 Tax=Agaribacterium haliotis TaxID=2013869 RepID=UPI000BB59EB8|nr:Ig-like domain-containing protein [Agaribacterium haliotis]